MNFQLLNPTQTDYYCNKILMPKGATDLLKEIAIRVSSDAILLDIYTEFYHTYIDSGYWVTAESQPPFHPFIEETFKESASLFYLLAALEKLPFTEQKYKELSIDENIWIDTMRDISTWVQNAYDRVGYYALRNMKWIWRHLECKLFRLGRLQYMPIELEDDIHGFIHKETKEIILLAGNDMDCQTNGDMQCVCGKERTDDGFITQFNETDTCYIGHPITSIGKCLFDPISLNKSDWLHILQKGDPLLDLHIPRDGDFSLATLSSSYTQAQTFFATHFPEFHYKGLYCYTWLFTPQLNNILSSSSKILSFQNCFYRYPYAGSKQFAWNFVFNDVITPQDAKPTNFLQEQILDYMLSDKELFELKGIYPEVGNPFGSNLYAN